VPPAPAPCPVRCAADAHAVLRVFGKQDQACAFADACNAAAAAGAAVASAARGAPPAGAAGAASEEIVRVRRLSPVMEVLEQAWLCQCTRAHIARRLCAGSLHKAHSRVQLPPLCPWVHAWVRVSHPTLPLQVFCEEVHSGKAGKYYRRFVAAAYAALWVQYSAPRPPAGEPRHFYEARAAPHFGRGATPRRGWQPDMQRAGVRKGATGVLKSWPLGRLPARGNCHACV
jgi:hypothetical protein